MVVELDTTVAGILLKTCVYNASGPRSGTSTALSKVAQSASGAVLAKSATVQKQSGNPQPRTWHHPDYIASFNSEGLPNNGIDYYIDATTIDDAMKDADDDKPYFVSLSGKSLNDNMEMLHKIASAPTKNRISAIELNLACPNVIGKPIIAYDVDQMDSILEQVSQLTDSLPPLGVKLPPYLDFQHFQQAASVLNRHKRLVKYVASINTLGNALAIDVVSEAPCISSNSGFAGLSGPAVHYTALANVRKLRELLDEDIDVVGVGGVRSGKDVFAMLLAGATAVQVGTCHWIEGPSCFDRIVDELRVLMEEKGCRRIEDVKGKLKAWAKEGAAKSRQALLSVAPAKTNSAAPLSSSELQFWKVLSAILIAVLAIICTLDKQLGQLLPEE
jgi:dihydroorotate dehydrogenase (fumarate)